MNQAAHEDPQTTVDRPWWVRFPLYGLPNRGSALASIVILVWVGALLVFYGFRDLRYSAFAILVVPAVWWYLKAIRWVDRHGGWPPKGHKK
jgi:hypothetical protein